MKKRICKVKGCKNKYYAKGYCSKHWMQTRRYGKILLRTIRTPNEIICKGKICEIVLYNNKSEEVARAIVDRHYLDKVEKYKWGLHQGGYVITVVDKKRLRLHHLILPRKKGFEVDHQFGNKLDNRKSKLRYATHQQNMRNRKNAKGYSWDKQREKFRAEIKVDGKSIYLGLFDREKDARKAYCEARILLFGEFVPIRN